MTTITSRTDLVNHVNDVRYDLSDHGLTEAVVDALQAADHPRWGSDWSDWLAATLTDELVASVIKASILTTDEGVEVSVGDYVVMGKGDGRDWGRVRAVKPGSAYVAWSAGDVWTWTDVADADVYTSAASAKAAYEAEVSR